jgi:hypothetical protein
MSDNSGWNPGIGFGNKASDHMKPFNHCVKWNKECKERKLKWQHYHLKWHQCFLLQSYTKLVLTNSFIIRKVDHNDHTEFSLLHARSTIYQHLRQSIVWLWAKNETDHNASWRYQNLQFYIVPYLHITCLKKCYMYIEDEFQRATERIVHTSDYIRKKHKEVMYRYILLL